MAYEAVPNKEPVNEVAVTLVVTFKEFREASDPDNITFFQLGIFSLYYGWLQDCACPLPFRAYNMRINMGKDTTNLVF